MKYFKNSELMRLYNVSDKSVRNWIEAAQQNKINLDLYNHNERTYIADTLHNGVILDELVENGRKYRNKRSHKDIEPTPEFYKTYGDSEILDIINNLDLYREIPQQYRFCATGASYWDEYLHKLHDAGKSNTLINTIELLQVNYSYLDRLTAQYNNVNIVDVGVGNGLAAKGVIDHFLNQGKLRKYIGIDISKGLLEVTKSNLREWFGNRFQIETYVKDITYTSFGGIITSDSYGEDANSTINIFLFLGATVLNFKNTDQPLNNIRDSMGKNDILLSSLKLDSATSRRFWDFNIESDKGLLPLYNKFLLNLLNIDDKFYEVEQFYDEIKRARLLQIKLKTAVSLQFEVGSYRKKVELQKGERILLWRANHYSEESIISQFTRNGFASLQTMKIPDQDYMLLTLQARAIRHPSPIT